jgi:hypothetical protein
MRFASWKYLKSGLSGLAAIASLGMLSYAPAASAEAISGTWGAGTSFNATGKAASLTLFSTVDANGTETTNPFSTLNDLSPFNETYIPNKSRVEVWAFRSPFGGYPQGGNMLLRWDPTLGGSKTPSLALPALPDGSYYLAVLGLVNQTGVTITNEPNCRWKNSNLNDLTSGDTQYCNFAVQLFDNLIGSLNCSSGSCSTSTAEPVGNIVPQTGGWWNPAESGRGYIIEVSNGVLVIDIQLYDASGTATWYIASGPLTADGSFAGQLRQYAGGQTLTGPYVEPTIINSNVGAISIKFSDSTNGILTQPDGRQIPITRFRF